jgi:4-amino-4-deoxy-L-arabinose transferase-like glycosyltransferase
MTPIMNHEKRILVIILSLFVLLGVTYALVTPAFEASDELWHYPMVRHLADGNPLPVQVFDPNLAGPWHQQASQPPLYYYLAAALTFWVDTSDMSQIRRLNPHVDTGVVTADGNINLAIHDPAANPWQGTLLSIRIVRLTSVLLGATTVLLTYHIARAVAPERPEIALGAAAVNAFTPMFLFISGAVNNDNLVIPLASLSLLLMIRLVSVHSQFSRTAAVRIHNSQFTISLLLLGTVIGLAALTKFSGVGLTLLALGSIFVALWQRSNCQITAPALVRILAQTMAYWLLMLLPVFLIAGWWYYRNWTLYGDWTGWNAFIAVLGQRPQPASLAQLWSERAGFLAAYWGLFGGLNVAMPAWIYTVLNTLLLAAVLTTPLSLYRRLQLTIDNSQLTIHNFLLSLYRRLQLTIDNSQLTIHNFLLSLYRRLQLTIDNSQLTIQNYFLSLTLRHFPLLLCLLWSLAIIYGLIQWTTITWSSQGRLVFTAISALITLFVTGLVGWLPRRWATAVVTLLATFLFIIAAAAPFLWIRPAYQPGRYTAPPGVASTVNVNFDNQLRLVSYEINPYAAADEALTTLLPGQDVDVFLEWEVMAPMTRDWSVFVHLNDPVLDAPLAQRDMYLDHGLRPTTLLEPGERIYNRYRLHLPATAVAPADLALVVGLYEYPSGERLPVTDGRDSATLAHLKVQSTPGQQPNPISENFGNELELVGFQVAPRRTQPGQTIAVTLYFRPRRPLRTNYTFFAQVVDLQGDLTRWASSDPSPPGGTSAWQPGAVYPMTFPLSLAADTPANIYPLIVGVYTQTADGGFQRLQLVTGDGRVTDQDFLRLTQIRVER